MMDNVKMADKGANTRKPAALFLGRAALVH